jgi:hypothetical protein
MMARGAISVQITGDYNNRDVKRAIDDLQLLHKQSGTTSSAMGGLSTAGVAMGAAVGGAALLAVQAGARMAVQFGKDSLKAFMDDDLAAQKLAGTLENLGLAHERAGVEKFIQQLQNSSAVADDVLRPSLDRLLRATDNVTQAQSLLSLALDIAATRGVSVEAATAALTKATNGSYGAIAKLSDGYSTAELKALGFKGTVAALTSDFAGGAATAASSYQGSIDKISLAFGDLQESLGKGFFSGVEKSMGSVKGGADKLQEAILSLQGGFETLGEAIGGAIQYVPRFVSAFKVMYDTMSIIWNAANMVVKSLYAVYQLSMGDAAGAMETLRGNASNLAGAFTAWRLAIGATVTGVEAGMGPMVGMGKAVTGIGTAFGKFSESVGSSATGVTSVVAAFSKAQAPIDNFAGSTSKATEESKKLAAAQKLIADAISSAQTVVNTAIEDFNKYKTKISEGIFSGFDFSAALDVVKEKGSNLIDVLVAQAERASEFGRKMSQLLAAGLNKTSYDQVIAMGAERGLDVADAFINGNIQENIKRVNDAASGAIAVADGVGAQSAMAFMQSGIDMAVALVKGLLEALGAKGKGRKALQGMMDDLASSMNRTANIAMTVTGPGGVLVAAPGVTPVLSPSDQSNLDNYLSGGIGAPEGGFFSGVFPGFANGGPVMGGKPIVVGEKGPELFVPGSNGNIVANGAGGNSYTINVSAGVGDPRAIGQQVVEYIKRFEQASGPVFVAA